MSSAFAKLSRLLSEVGAERWLRVRHIFDALVVLIASPVLGIIAAIAMAAVLIEDRHNPLIRLRRVGRGGAPMDVTKIRSMRVGGGAAITSSDDGRITRTGRRLRSFRIDEIPQVIQVFTGEMALIGPRPESPEFVDLEDPAWKAVLSARPAIAGMTQVIAGPWEAEHLDGVHAEALYREVALPAKLAIDRWYVENASPIVDLKIVVSVFGMLVLGSDTTPVHKLAAKHLPAAVELLRTSPKASL